MDLGVIMFNGYALPPADLARAVEERGFESLFFPEHTHVPVRSSHPDGRDMRRYSRAFDPFVSLGAAAAVTTRIKLGTAVCLVAQRDPIITAKEVATVDHLSGGRMLFGVGAGWNREEMANHGTDPRTRMTLLAENIKAMKAIWTEEEAEFHGSLVDFDPIWLWPKPVRRPHPPVLVGGSGPTTEDRVLDFGDEWFPQLESYQSIEELGERIAALRERAGRRIPVTLFEVPADRDTIEKIEAIGVDRCLMGLRAEDAANGLSNLDVLAKLLG